MSNNINKIYRVTLRAMSALFALVSAVAVANTEDGIPDLVSVIGNVDKVTVAGSQSLYNISFLIAIVFGLLAVIIFAASLRNNGSDQTKTKGVAAGLFLVSVVAGGIGTWQNIANKQLTGQATEASAWMTEIQSEIHTE